MNIWLEDIGKNYNDKWVFRHVNFIFQQGTNYAIFGENGSGKSTLLKIISGYGIPTEGKLVYENISDDKIYEQIAMTAPYIDVYEELSLNELVNFQRKFKPFNSIIEEQAIEDLFQLKGVRDQKIKSYSSGMKQRVKLGLAILSDVPILLLDEPISNLDEKGVEWYQKLIDNYTEDKTVIVCSNNIQSEYDFCEESINIEDFK